MLRTLILLSLLLPLLYGCDAIEDFQQMGEKQSRVQAMIQEKYGWHVNLGWNIHNAELTQVTLVFSADEVAKAKNTAFMASRSNTLMSIPMIMSMVGAGHGWFM